MYNIFFVDDHFLFYINDIIMCTHTHTLQRFNNIILKVVFIYKYGPTKLGCEKTKKKTRR